MGDIGTNAKKEWRNFTFSSEGTGSSSDHVAFLDELEEEYALCEGEYLAACGGCLLAVTPDKEKSVGSWTVRVLSSSDQTMSLGKEDSLNNVVHRCVLSYANENKTSSVAGLTQHGDFSHRKTEHFRSMVFMRKEDGSYVTAREYYQSIRGSVPGSKKRGGQKRKQEVKQTKQENGKRRRNGSSPSQEEEERAEEQADEAEEQEEDEEEEEEKGAKDTKEHGDEEDDGDGANGAPPDGPMLPLRRGERDVNATGAAVLCTEAKDATVEANLTGDDGVAPVSPEECCRLIEPGAPCLYIPNCGDILCSASVRKMCEDAYKSGDPLMLPKCKHGNVLAPADVARHVSKRGFARLQDKLRKGLRLMSKEKEPVFDAGTRSFSYKPRWDAASDVLIAGWNVLAATEQRTCGYGPCSAPLPGPPRPGSALLLCCARCHRLNCALCGSLCTDNPQGHREECDSGNGSGHLGIAKVATPGMHEGETAVTHESPTA